MAPPPDVPKTSPLDAGRFSTWLDTFNGALEGGSADVPCGSCTACCSSSQFVHIAPDEVDTLAHIPSELLFPAPQRPAGHVVMGYDENGRCPMLTETGCSVYEHRPRTCRTYDCRVFAATGLELGGPEKAAIDDRVRRWRFRFPADADRVHFDALRTAVATLADLAPDQSVTERTLAALELHHLFVAVDVDGRPRPIVADRDEVDVELRARRRPAP